MEKISGTVVKLTEKYIVLIMPDGSFKNVRRSRNQTPLIGERVTMEESRISVLNYRWAAIAAVACLALAAILKLGILLPNDINPAYIIALDINPSIEIQTDKQFKILSITALNEDGKKVIGETAYSNIELFDALNTIVGKCISSGYLKQEKKGFIKITVIPIQGKSFIYENRIKASLQRLLGNNNIDASLEIGSASVDILEKARQSKLSVNRYILYQSLIEKGIDVTAEEAGGMSLQGLRDYEALQKSGAEKAAPRQENSAKDTGEAGFDTMQGDTGGTGVNGAASPDSSKNSDISELKGNTDSTEEGTAQNDMIGGKTGGISGAVFGDNADNGSSGAEARPDTAGTESGSTEGKESASESTTGSENTSTSEPAKSGSQTNDSVNTGQAPAGTNSGGTDSSGTGSGAAGPVEKSGANQTAGSSGK